MTQFTLSANTQALINAAVADGPGTNNANYLAAYNAIYSDIEANGGVNSGTAYWFSQAGLVNTQLFSPNATGTYIWTFTEAAVASEGGTATNAVMQAASNKIGATVFQDLQSNDFVFSDNPSATVNFSPTQIINVDAGAGFGVIQAANTAPIDYAAWGGTLFAQTALDDPTYASNYNLNLTLNSEDCKAIFSGFNAAASAELASGNITTVANSLLALFNLDTGMLDQCAHSNSLGLTSSSPTVTVTSAGSGVYDINVGEDLSTGGTFASSTTYNTNNSDWSATSNDFNNSGQKTDGTTLTYANGSLTSDLQGLNTSGGVTYTQNTTSPATGQTTASISGTGDIADLSDASISLAAGTQAALDGVSNVVSLANNAALTLAGSSNTVTGPSNPTAPTGITVMVAGPLDNVDLSYSTAVIENNATGTTVTGSDNTVSAGSNASLTVGSGSSANTVSVTGNSSTVTDNGSGNTLSSSGNSNNIVAGTSDAVALSGDSDAVGAAARDTVSISGNGADGANGGDYVFGSNVSVNVAANAGTAVIGNSDSITAGSGDYVNLNGADNTINAGAGDLFSVEGNGANGSNGDDTVNGSSLTVYVSASAGAVVNGNSDTVDVSGTAVSLVVTGDSNAITGTGGDTIQIGGNGANGSSGSDTVTMSSGTLNMTADAGATVTGNSDTLGAYGASDSLTVNGHSNAIIGTASDTIQVEGNGADGTNGDDTVSGSSFTVDVLANAGAAVTGNSDTVHASTGDAVAMSGDSNAVSAGSGDTVSVSGNGANGANGGDYVYGTSLSVNVLANAGTAVIGNSDSITAGSGDYVNLNGASNTIHASAGDLFSVEGNGEWGGSGGDNVDGTSLTVYVASDAGVAINGTLDTINGTTGDLVVTGATGANYDTVNMTGGIIDATAGNLHSYGSSDTINASDVAITLGSSETHLTIVGSGDIVYAGNYDQISFDGNDDATYGSYDIVSADGSDDDIYGEDDYGEGDEGGDGDGGDGGDDDMVTGGAGGSSGGAVKLKNGASLTITSSANTVSVAGNDVLTIAAGSSLNTVTISGRNSTIVDDGAFDSITVGSSANTINVSGNVSPDVAVSLVTFNGTGEEIALANSDTIAVATGVAATIIGADGTMTVSNQAGAGENTIVWNTGGSEVQNFTLLSGGAVRETDTGYSGSNGFGTALYQQVTTTGTSGAISSNISGDGADSALNNASITLANSAEATLAGTGDTVTVGGNGSLAIANGFGNTVTVSGNGTSVSDTTGSGGNAFVLNGAGDSATLNGGGDAVTLGGHSNTATIAAGATSGAAIISGTDDTLAVAGTSSENITFDLNALDTLLIQSTQGFNGTVAGLAAGDGIDLADFQFSNGATISSVTGSGAVGTTTDISITDGAQITMLALLNQYANQFGVSSSAYTLTADSTQPNAGTLLQLAASH
jgi:hypothetical protein